MSEYADIAIPVAVRQNFTYRIGEELQGALKIGMRVWVPFGNYNAIGIVVRLHDDQPGFKTKKIKKLLDAEPVVENELLELCDWVHRFYYCSLGEVLQAALPAGLNFVSRKYLRVNESFDKSSLTDDEDDLYSEVEERTHLELEEAKKRWKNTSYSKVLNKLLSRRALEIWEEPHLKTNVKTERAWLWADGKSKVAADEYLSGIGSLLKWHRALEAFSKMGMPARNSELAHYDVFTSYALNKLKAEGWISPIELKVMPDKLNLEYSPGKLPVLNEEQNEAFDLINESLIKQEYAGFLLNGITGSGKTEVYIRALHSAVEMGRGGIVLVPEIALTPQTVARFYKVFGEKIAVLHSRLTPAERLAAWQDLKKGIKNIVIGPRSAVFAPIKDPGIIILDEEHDSSYKQEEPAPRYHARETAIMRASRNNAVLIMGSATPSMQALHMAAKGKCTFLELKNRYADAELPEVAVIDLKQYRNAMKGSLSSALYEGVERALSKREQVILLYNRRGFAGYLQCENCGHIPQSPDCSVSLTYHKYKNILLCHYSGYSRRADTRCEQCGSENLVAKGLGTQKVEEELETLFPDARILRFDRDSTTKKDAYSNILNAFGNGEADILVGTQLVSKGLDFPNVTVVGVVDADTELAFPSFYSGERMFQLLSQVAGRSGRGQKAGKVFFQTRNPELPAIQFAAQHNYKDFAREELKFRKALRYPPYSRLIQFELKGKEETEVERAASILANVIHKVLPHADTLGPSPAAIIWKNRNYFWELILRIDPEKGDRFIGLLLDKITEIYDSESNLSRSKVRININVDSIR